jgi:KDO2-lipid IV(A) lauroyltransferase
MPLPLASTFLASFVRTFARRLTRFDVICENLSLSFPELEPREIRALARQIAANLGRVIAELRHITKFRGAGADGTFSFTGRDQLELARRRPVVFVGTHQGNWELVPLFLAENGIALTNIYAPIGNPTIDRVVLATRLKTGTDYVEKRFAARAAFHAIANGRSVSLLAEPRVSSGVVVKFFGRNSVITNLPARLALRFGCPIIPVAMTRLAGTRFHITFGACIHPPTERTEHAECAVTQAIANQLERNIRSSPETWFCNKRRWPKKTR